MRRAAQRRGQRAERLAIWRLWLVGYRILARNYRTPVGEIDLVATRGRLVAFVEVKLRDQFDAAAEAVSGRQQDRIYRAAELFLAARPQLADHEVRFDVILVAPRSWPRHLRDTWREKN